MSLIMLLESIDLTTLTWQRILPLYLTAQFLLVREDGLGDLRIVSLLPQLAGATTLAPLILAETLIGLDKDRRGSHYFARVQARPCLCLVPRPSSQHLKPPDHSSKPSRVK
ncbi:conserved hypothetical protein [Ricinus communis]|uniref:Uncharacterized protein n=1 Tax=Ricinus communis TaxID=3988 RepID=B9S9B9_RICCO|nr:conserved hypothetical protein [Ricinus communis]